MCEDGFRKVCTYIAKTAATQVFHNRVNTLYSFRPRFTWEGEMIFEGGHFDERPDWTYTACEVLKEEIDRFIENKEGENET